MHSVFTEYVESEAWVNVADVHGRHYRNKTPLNGDKCCHIILYIEEVNLKLSAKQHKTHVNLLKTGASRTVNKK